MRHDPNPTPRRGSIALALALGLPILLGVSALVLDTGYAWVVRHQLQNRVDAAAHAAVLDLDGTEAGMEAALETALRVAGENPVWGDSAIDEDDVIFGTWDETTGTFTESDDPAEVDAIRIVGSADEVGFGFARLAFGRDGIPVSARATVVQGPGEASTGDTGGPGLANGHFDYDTTDADDCEEESGGGGHHGGHHDGHHGHHDKKKKHDDGEDDGEDDDSDSDSESDSDSDGHGGCHDDEDTGSSLPDTCTTTSKHTHEYDDKYDVTGVDFFAAEESAHVDIDEAFDGSQNFKIIVANADLSPGAVLTINGESWNVTEYDDLETDELTVWSIDGGGVGEQLTDFSIEFDVDAIASCELMPTNTGDVRANTEGPNGEWRNGALTIQAVAVDDDGNDDFTTDLDKSAGGVQGVATPATGLLWEATFFWHWDGPSYHESDWQDWYDDLVCTRPRFVE